MGLGGKRVKQVISPDPRNTQWAKDTDKFGYRMLCKMGWSEGRGLGADESGTTEHVRITKKDDNLGVGATRRTIDNWLDNTSAFDALLQSLNSPDEANGSTSTADPCAPSNSTTEASNPPTIAPVHRLSHRARFQRAKRNAVADGKHLDAILGIKGSSAEVNANADAHTRSAAAPTPMPTLETVVSSRVSALSVEEYFQQRLAAKRARTNGETQVVDRPSASSSTTSPEHSPPSPKAAVPETKEQRRQVKEQRRQARAARRQVKEERRRVKTERRLAKAARRAVKEGTR